jgi:hypothetical protein
VYMARPNTSPDVVRAMEQCGARVVIDDTTIADAYQTARDVANRDGLVFIDPISGDRSLIIGCATVAVEMLESLPRQVEHRPAQAQSAHLTRKAADDLGPAADLLQRALQQIGRHHLLASPGWPARPARPTVAPCRSPG